MKSFNLTRTTGVIIALMLAFSTVSCDDDEYYSDSPVLGTWGLSAINGMPIYDDEYSEFTFYNDGTGVFGQYSVAGLWETYPITYSLDTVPAALTICTCTCPATPGRIRYALRTARSPW
ncbi:MAG: hypothetical protein NC043_04145 [Muribaculaceae bacterium]|nr:hypothetical protein [Muribaculaceae bacterium]